MITFSTLIIGSTGTPSAVTDEPPTYELTETLEYDGSFYYVKNSASSGDKYDGKLLNDLGATWTSGETSARYDAVNSTIDLSDDYYIDTGYTPPQNAEYFMAFVDNYDGNGNYDMYAMDANEDNITVDIWYGNQDSDLSLLAINTGLLYTRTTSNILISETRQVLPIIPIATFGTIADITNVTAVTINITFNTSTTLELTDFETPTYGTLDNVSGSGTAWTVDYTADADVINQNDQIILKDSTYTDSFGNSSPIDTESEIFNVNTATLSVVDTFWINFGSVDRGTVYATYFDSPTDTTVTDLTNTSDSTSAGYTGQVVTTFDFTDNSGTTAPSGWEQGIVTNSLVQTGTGETSLFKVILGASTTYNLELVSSGTGGDTDSADVTINGGSLLTITTNQSADPAQILEVTETTDTDGVIEFLFSYDSGGAGYNGIKIEELG